MTAQVIPLRAHECDACGRPSPSTGLRLCAGCEALETEAGGDLGLVAEWLAQR
jgi:hypothetical protein